MAHPNQRHSGYHLSRRGMDATYEENAGAIILTHILLNLFTTTQTTEQISAAHPNQRHSRSHLIGRGMDATY
jgi:hypothetical protein